MHVTGIIKSMRKDRKGIQLDTGVWYSSFRALPEAIAAGLEVTFECVQKGQWNNIQGTITVLGGTPKFGGGQSPQTNSNVNHQAESTTTKLLPPNYEKLDYATLVKTFPVPFDHPDRAIIRQNSLTNAVNLVTHAGKDLSKVDLPHLVEHVLEVAQSFEAYSTGDIERKALDALTELANSEDGSTNE